MLLKFVDFETANPVYLDPAHVISVLSDERKPCSREGFFRNVALVTLSSGEVKVKVG